MKTKKKILSAIVILTVCSVANAAMSAVSYAADIDSASDADLIGSWLVEAIEHKPVIDRSSASFQFSADGKLSGNASCNRFTGEFDSSGGILVFDELAVTGLTCIGVQVEQEGRFAKALRRIRIWKIEDNFLLLFDEYGVELFRAAGIRFE